VKSADLPSLKASPAIRPERVAVETITPSASGDPLQCIKGNAIHLLKFAGMRWPHRLGPDSVWPISFARRWIGLDPCQTRRRLRLALCPDRRINASTVRPKARSFRVFCHQLADMVTIRMRDRASFSTPSIEGPLNKASRQAVGDHKCNNCQDLFFVVFVDRAMHFDMAAGFKHVGQPRSASSFDQKHHRSCGR